MAYIDDFPHPIIPNPEWPSLKFLVIGYYGMGKSCLLTRYIQSDFSEDHLSIVLDEPNCYRYRYHSQLGRYEGYKNYNRKPVEYEGQMWHMAAWESQWDTLGNFGKATISR